MAKYRNGSEIVEAFRWTGDHDQTEEPAWAVEALVDGRLALIDDGTPRVTLRTKVGGIVTIASQGDWIIKGPSGVLFACEPDLFAKLYEPAERSN